MLEDPDGATASSLFYCDVDTAVERVGRIVTPNASSRYDSLRLKRFQST